MLATTDTRWFTHHMSSLERHIPDLPTAENYAQAVATVDEQVGIFCGVTDMLNIDGKNRRKFDRNAHTREAEYHGMLRERLVLSTDATTFEAFTKGVKLGILTARIAHDRLFEPDAIYQDLLREREGEHYQGVVELGRKGIDLLGVENEQTIASWSVSAMPNGIRNVTFKAGVGLVIYGAYRLHTDLRTLYDKARHPKNWDASFVALPEHDTDSET